MKEEEQKLFQKALENIETIEKLIIGDISKPQEKSLYEMASDAFSFINEYGDELKRCLRDMEGIRSLKKYLIFTLIALILSTIFNLAPKALNYLNSSGPP